MEGVSELKIERDANLPSVELVPRSSIVGTAVILAVVVALSAFMVLPSAFTAWMLLLAAVLGILSIIARSVQGVHVALFSLLWIGLPFIFPALHPYPLKLLVPLVVYGVIVATVPSLRRSLLWLRSGHFSSDILLLVLATIVVSGSALVGWYYLIKPDINSHLEQMPKLSVWMLPLVAIGFAMLNAAMEEVAFRGVIMQALDSAIGVGMASIIIQAVSFGLFHYTAGFPNGGWGLAMVIVYGFMLGMLRRRSQGLLACWLAHVVADVVIFGILAIIVVAG